MTPPLLCSLYPPLSLYRSRTTPPANKPLSVTAARRLPSACLRRNRLAHPPRLSTPLIYIQPPPARLRLTEWLLAGFALFHHLLQHHPGPQVWLTDININAYCQSIGPLLYGPPSQSHRQVMFEHTNLPLYAIVRTAKLCSTFRKHLNSTLTTPSRVLAILCAYGFPECEEYVLLEKNKFHGTEFGMIVRSGAL